MSDLPVPAVAPPEVPTPQTLVCANCHADLTGEYCARCGQRHEPHIHTVAHFAGEALESLSHADSRLWRTLWYLSSRPGFLTREFFAGRRVAYLPPFRLYLVLSVIFFLLNGLTNGHGREDAPTISARVPAAAAAPGSQAAAPAPAEITADPSGAPAPRLELGVDAEREGSGMRVHSPGLEEFCKEFDVPETGGSGATARRNIRHFCKRVREDTTSLFTELGHNLPRAMFIFLPLLAGIMKLLYWRPKRYYVEHLLFLVHNHAFVFLVMTFFVLVDLVLDPLVGDYVWMVYFSGFGYTLWYIFKAMRNVYAQNRLLTFGKYLFLAVTYLVTALATVLLTLVFLALVG